MMGVGEAGERRFAEVSEPPELPDAPRPHLLADAERSGTLEVVKIADINIDHTYQRDLNHDLVQKIASDFDMAVAGAIHISRRSNGSLWAIDGAHRLAGATLAGETEMLAQVQTGLTQQEEAVLRLRGNVKRTDKSSERFKAQVAAGNPESIAIVEICKLFDTQINLNPVAGHGLNGVAAVEEIYRRNKGILLTAVFEMIRDAFGTVGGPTSSVAMLKGLAWLIARHQTEMDRGRMIDKLGREGPASIERKARTMRASMGGALWMNYYRCFIDFYNERLPEHAKLEWRTGGWSKIDGSGYGDK